MPKLVLSDRLADLQQTFGKKPVEVTETRSIGEGNPEVIDWVCSKVWEPAIRQAMERPNRQNIWTVIEQGLPIPDAEYWRPKLLTALNSAQVREHYELPAGTKFVLKVGTPVGDSVKFRLRAIVK
jgi:hypothetical protein